MCAHIDTVGTQSLKHILLWFQTQYYFFIINDHISRPVKMKKLNLTKCTLSFRIFYTLYLGLILYL